MHSSLKKLIFALAAVAAWGQANGFVVTPEIPQTTTKLFAHESRRGFIVASFGAAVGILASGNSPVLAVDDLAMPTEEEEKAREKAEMEERLRRKAELKAKAAAPKTFQDSMAAELEKKKKEKTMSKEERRNALCEDLGRGC